MALRVTEGEVKALMRTGLDESQLTPHLHTANAMINDVLAGMGYGDELLTKIELWLAAHFVSITDPAVKSEQIGETNVTYHGNIIGGQGLSFTPYGQQVLALEYKGKFASLGNIKGSAEMKVI